MIGRSRRERPLVAVLSIALVLSILLPVAAGATEEPRHAGALQLSAPADLLVAGPPFPISFDLALNSFRTLSGRHHNTTRQQQVVIVPRLDPLPAASLESASTQHFPRFIWCKNRRYVCQLLDIPPPFCAPSCVL